MKRLSKNNKEMLNYIFILFNSVFDSVKKITGALVVIIFILTQSSGQGIWNNITLKLDASLSQDDKRMFNYSESDRSKMKRHDPGVMGDVGTYSYGVSIEKIWGLKEKVPLHAGIGYRFEKQTFPRKFDHCYYNENSFCTDIDPGLLKVYKVHMLQLPIEIGFKIRKNIYIKLVALSIFDFLKNLNGYSHTEFNFYSLELNPEIEYTWDKYSIGINYRVWQLKKVDPVYISPRLDGTKDHTVMDRNYEFYNPIKLGVRVGYRLGGH